MDQGAWVIEKLEEKLKNENDELEEQLPIKYDVIHMFQIQIYILHLREYFNIWMLH